MSADTFYTIGAALACWAIASIPTALALGALVRRGERQKAGL